MVPLEISIFAEEANYISIKMELAHIALVKENIVSLYEEVLRNS